MRRSLLSTVLVLSLAPGLRADSALDVHALFESAAGALSDGKAAAFEAVFDPKMPGLAKMRAQVEALLRTFDSQSSIEWQKNEGDDQTRTVQLNWLLEITGRGGAAELTRRRDVVACQLKKSAQAWRIVSFTPADFFAPPQAEEAWNALATAAMGLTEAAVSGAGLNRDADVPVANTTKFMQAFDPAMAAYGQLKDSVLSLEQGWDVESTVDLVRNEGDDRVRTIEVDWSLNLVSRDTSVTAVQRAQRVTCKVEKQGKRWRIVALEPLALFAPAGR